MKLIVLACLTVCLTMATTLPLPSGTRVLLIGDSIITNLVARTATWVADIGGTVSSSGVSGAQCDAVRTTWDTLVHANPAPQLILLHCAANDAAHSRPIADTEADIAYMLGDAQSRSIPVIVDDSNNVFVTGPSDSRYLWIVDFNNWMAATYSATSTGILLMGFHAWISQPASPWLDSATLTSDGAHLTTAASDEWIGLIRDRINDTQFLGGPAGSSFSGILGGSAVIR